MSERSLSFIRLSGNGFSIDWRKVPAESWFATARLLREICVVRHHARGRLLDIGCGTKPYEVVFAENVSEHIGIDVPVTRHGHTRIDAFATALAVPFKDESFDTVLCTEVLEHVPDPFVSMREIARVLRPGGTAIVTTPFMYRVHEAPYDFFRYTRFAHEELARRAGLDLVSIATRGGLLSVMVDMGAKWCAAVVSALNAMIAKVPGTRRHLLETTPVKFWFWIWQAGYAAVLGKENVKSAQYTLGYVVVLRKR